jgi:hypothetical protein
LEARKPIRKNPAIIIAITKQVTSKCFFIKSLYHNTGVKTSELTVN